MNYKQLTDQIFTKQSFLCIGLDTDINLIPSHLRKNSDPVFAFNKEIIDAVAPYVIAVKPNIAFYESRGPEGWKSLEDTVGYIRTNYPGLFLIADAKRGDIGNTSKMYAEAFFNRMDFDAITLSPYMGSDSIQPFLEYKGKWVILLALTSNKGSDDFQMVRTGQNERLFETVLHTSAKWGDKSDIMYVVGATKASMLVTVRDIVPDHFLLVPGIGAQGGSLEDVYKYGHNSNCGLIVNSSRAIIYASNTEKFAEKAASQAKKVQQQMAALLQAREV